MMYLGEGTVADYRWLFNNPITYYCLLLEREVKCSSPDLVWATRAAQWYQVTPRTTNGPTATGRTRGCRDRDAQAPAPRCWTLVGFVTILDHSSIAPRLTCLL